MMRTRSVAWFVIGSALLSSFGCDDEGGSDLPDGGGGQAGSISDAAPVTDTAIKIDAAGGKGGSAAADASSADAAIDAAPTDAASAQSDAGPPPNALYAHIAGKLVSVNPTTGAVAEIGATGQTYIVLAWDDAAKVARVITDIYSPVGGAATPTLGTIDLCTGAIAAGPAITLDATPVRRAEGLARHPGTGKFHITFGRTGAGVATEFLSESNGTVDVTTGAVTLLGNHDTFQDDGDNLLFVGTTLYLLDVAVTTNQGAVYTIDQSTGTATSVTDTGSTVLRLANDWTRGVVFAAYGTSNGTMRGVAALNLATGARTPVGAGLPNAAYPGEGFTGLMSAPAPICR